MHASAFSFNLKHALRNWTDPRTPLIIHSGCCSSVACGLSVCLFRSFLRTSYFLPPINISLALCQLQNARQITRCLSTVYAFSGTVLITYCSIFSLVSLLTCININLRTSSNISWANERTPRLSGDRKFFNALFRKGQTRIRRFHSVPEPKLRHIFD